MTKGNFLITRPTKEALQDSTELTKLGFNCVTEPLIQIHAVNDLDAKLKNIEQSCAGYIIATSKNSIDLLSKCEISKHKQLIVTGDDSYKLASAIGFANCVNCQGGVDDVVRYVQKNIPPRENSIIYARGDNITLDMSALLRKKSFNIHDMLLYKSVASSELRPNTLSLIRSKKLDYVSFLSTRTAQVFASLIAKYQLENALTGLTALCFSTKITQALQGLRFKTILKTEESNKASLLRLIKSLV